MQNFFFWGGGNVWKSVRNYMEVIENILRYIKNKNLKIDRKIIFHTYANFSCLYLKIGLCDLFPVLLEGVHHKMWISFHSGCINFKWSSLMLMMSQGPDTRRLVFQVPLCHWFNIETFQPYTGISEFCVTLDSVCSNCFLYFITNNISSSKKCHSANWGSQNVFLVCQGIPCHAPKCPIFKFLTCGWVTFVLTILHRSAMWYPEHLWYQYHLHH